MSIEIVPTYFLAAAQTLRESARGTRRHTDFLQDVGRFLCATYPPTAGKQIPLTVRQFGAMLYFFDGAGHTPRHMSDDLHIPTATVVGILTSLREGGYVAIEHVAGKRRPTYRITNKGIRLMTRTQRDEL